MYIGSFASWTELCTSFFCLFFLTGEPFSLESWTELCTNLFFHFFSTGTPLTYNALIRLHYHHLLCSWTDRLRLFFYLVYNDLCFDKIALPSSAA